MLKLDLISFRFNSTSSKRLYNKEQENNNTSDQFDAGGNHLRDIRQPASAHMIFELYVWCGWLFISLTKTIQGLWGTSCIDFCWCMNRIWIKLSLKYHCLQLMLLLLWPLSKSGYEKPINFQWPHLEEKHVHLENIKVSNWLSACVWNEHA